MANGAESTNFSETSNPRIPLSKTTHGKTKDIFKTCNPRGHASKDFLANNIEDGNGINLTALFPVDNNSAFKDIGPKYDPERLISKRIIRSDAVSKTRLVNRDAKMQESITQRPVEDDATFFENLKKRINEDLGKNIISKIPKPRTERSPKVRKRKSLFDSDSLKLIKKFRDGIKEHSARILEEEKIEHLSVSQNQENVDVHQMPQDTVDDTIILDHKMSRNLLLDNFEIDGNSLCTTPPSPLNTTPLSPCNTMKYF